MTRRGDSVVLSDAGQFWGRNEHECAASFDRPADLGQIGDSGDAILRCILLASRPAVPETLLIVQMTRKDRPSRGRRLS